MMVIVTMMVIMIMMLIIVMIITRVGVERLNFYKQCCDVKKPKIGKVWS